MVGFFRVFVLLGLVGLPGLFGSILDPEVLTTRAQADCANNHTRIGGQQNQASNNRGTRADILVNSFTGSAQHNTWRDVAVFVNRNNYAETGWQRNEQHQAGKHPFKTWADDGDLRTHTFQNINLSDGVRHDSAFMIKTATTPGRWRTAETA